jgi:hypothetical protein
MVHPVIERERGAAPPWTTASWTTEGALETVWSRQGWQAAPPGVLPDRWDAGRCSMVRDLLDRDDIVHVPLRVGCRRHGAAVVDRNKLLHQIRTATRPRWLPLHTVCAS